MNVFDIIFEYRVAFWNGLKVTLKLCLFSWLLGIVLGTLIGVLSYNLNKVVGKIVNFISFFIMSIPFLVLLYWAHYPLQELIQVNIDPYFTSLSILIFINSFGVASIVYSSLIQLPQEYLMAGKIYGLSNLQIISKIQIPLIIRYILPPIITLQVSILHLTLFTSLISVEEIFRVCQRINSTIYKPIEIYTALAIFFIVFCIPINGVAFLLKNKFLKQLKY